MVSKIKEKERSQHEQRVAALYSFDTAVSDLLSGSEREVAIRARRCLDLTANGSDDRVQKICTLFFRHKTKVDSALGKMFIDPKGLSTHDQSLVIRMNDMAGCKLAFTNLEHDAKKGYYELAERMIADIDLPVWSTVRAEIDFICNEYAIELNKLKLGE